MRRRLAIVFVLLAGAAASSCKENVDGNRDASPGRDGPDARQPSDGDTADAPAASGPEAADAGPRVDRDALDAPAPSVADAADAVTVEDALESADRALLSPDALELRDLPMLADVAMPIDASGLLDAAITGPDAAGDAALAEHASATNDGGAPDGPGWTEAEGGTTDLGAIGEATLVLDLTTVNLGTFGLGSVAMGVVHVTNVGQSRSGPLVVTASAGLVAAGCASALAPGELCTLSISVTLTAPGPYSGTVAISANPGATTPLAVAVLAVAETGNPFSVVPTAIDLGNVIVGAEVTAQVTVTAVRALTDLSLSSSGIDLVLDRPLTTCLPALAAGSSCTAVVRFVATTSGPRSDHLLVSAGGRTVSVPISATALTRAKLVISPSTPQSFAAIVGQPSSPLTFGVANAGDVATGTVTATLTGADAGDFRVTSSCSVLGPLQSCTLAVTFAPAAGAGTARSARLTVVESGPAASSVSVSLSGTAYPG